MSDGSDNRCGYDDDDREEPCQRFTDGGRCADHDEEAEKTRERVKSLIIDYLKGEHPDHDALTLRDASREAGRTVDPERYPDLSRYAVYKWRQQDSDFDARLEQAQEHQDQIRVEMVETAVFREIIEGNAASSLAIFWLINRAPERWKDKSEVHQLLGKSGEGVDDLEIPHERLAEAHEVLAGEHEPEGEASTGSNGAPHTE